MLGPVMMKPAVILPLKPRVNSTASRGQPEREGRARAYVSSSAACCKKALTSSSVFWFASLRTCCRGKSKNS